MGSTHARRAVLERRIRWGNGFANFFGLLTVVCALMAINGRYVDRWLIAACFVMAGCVTAVRIVTAARIEHFRLGLPRPELIELIEPDDPEPDA